MFVREVARPVHDDLGCSASSHALTRTAFRRRAPSRTERHKSRGLSRRRQRSRALAVLFMALLSVATFLFRGVRLDLTENKLYTIAPGTKRVLASPRVVFTGPSGAGKTSLACACLRERIPHGLFLSALKLG